MQIQHILAPISLGELIDKITILKIKTRHCQGASLRNVEAELDCLEAILKRIRVTVNPTLIQELQAVNQDLWTIEDEIRSQEHKKDFGEIFIHLARSVYLKNDQRSTIKKKINTIYDSTIIEEKLYKHYD